MSRTHTWRLSLVVGGLLVFAWANAFAEEQRREVDAMTDPRLELAQLTQAEIEKRERDLNRVLSEVSEAIDRMAPDKLDQEKLAVQGLRQLVAQLRRLAGELVDGYGAYRESTDALRESLERAGPIFREASKVFEQYAKEEPYEEIKQDYLLMATAWKDMANTMSKRAAELEYSPAEMDEAIQYLKRSALFLKRLDSHLASYPNLDAGETRQRYVEQMQRYMKGMSELRTLFKKFHQNLKAQALTLEVRGYPLKIVKADRAVFKAPSDAGFKTGGLYRIHRPDSGKVGMIKILSADNGHYVVAGAAGSRLQNGDTVVQRDFPQSDPRLDTRVTVTMEKPGTLLEPLALGVAR